VFSNIEITFGRRRFNAFYYAAVELFYG